MKRADIKAGVIYATRSSYGPPAPIMFLEDAAAGIYSRQRDGGIHQHEENKYTKARKSRGWSDNSIGYAAVVGAGLYAAAEQDEQTLLSSLDPAAELELFRGGQKPSAVALRFTITTSLSQITDWDDEMARYRARQDADRAKVAASQAKAARRTALMETLADLGVTSQRSHDPRYIDISLDEADKLVALLQAKEN